MLNRNLEEDSGSVAVEKFVWDSSITLEHCLSYPVKYVVTIVGVHLEYTPNR